MNGLQLRPTFIRRLESCNSQDLDDYAVPADLFTHTVEHTHLLQVSGTSSRWLHKAKKGEKSSAKKANAGAITLLRKNYNENSGRNRGRERRGNYGGEKKTTSR